MAGGRERWVQKGEFSLVCTIAGLIAIIFAVDLWTPKGISVWALYIIPLLLTIWSPSRRLPLLTASVCTGLAVVGYILSPTIIPSWMSVANRMIGILVIWIVAFLLAKHKQTETVLRSSETRFHQMAETVQEAFWMATPDVATTTYISPAYERIWGRSRESLVANPTSWLDAIHSEDRERVVAALTRYRYGEATMEYRIVRPDGSIRWIWDHGCPVRNDRGEISGIAGFAMDITTRKLAETALAESEKRLAMVLQVSSEGIYDWNIKTGAVYYSPRWIESLGYTPDEVPPHVGFWESIVHPEDMPLVREKLRAHLEGRTPVYEHETRMRTKAGNWRWTLDRGKIVERDTDGTPLRMVGADADTTQRKTAQQALLRTTEELTDLYHHAPCGYHSLDKNGLFVDVNHTELAWLGYAREELVRKRAFTDLLTEDSRKVFRIQFSRVQEQGWMRALAFDMVRKNGTTLPVLVSATAVTDADGKYVEGRFTLLDITERKRAEEEREGLILRLEEALANVKTLRGLLSICSGCQKVQDDKGSWRDLETYVRHHSEADFHHALCPMCAETLFPGFYKRWKDTH